MFIYRSFFQMTNCEKRRKHFKMLSFKILNINVEKVALKAQKRKLSLTYLKDFNIGLSFVVWVSALETEKDAHLVLIILEILTKYFEGLQIGKEME